jgi:hypothetical protein
VTALFFYPFSGLFPALQFSLTAAADIVVLLLFCQDLVSDAFQIIAFILSILL